MPASSSASSPAPTFGVVALLPSDGRLLSGSDHAFLFAGNQLYRIDARGILQDVSLFRGLPPSYHEHYRTNAFFGSFPDAFWVQIGGSSRKPETYRWAAGRWGRVYPLDEGEALLSVVLIGKKRAVGLVTGEQGRLRLIRGNDQSNPPSPLTEIAAPPSSASASVLPSAEPPASAAPLLPAEAPSASASALASASASGAPPAPSASAPAAVERRPSRLRNGTLQQRLKEQNQALTPPKKGDEERAPTLAGGRPLAGLPSGHLFVIGVDGELTSRRVLVERWNAQGRSVVDELPEAEDPVAGELGIVAAAPDDAYAFTVDHGSYLVHLEGTEWKREKVPSNLMIHDMLAPGDGSYYLATEGPLFRKEKGGSTWTEVPLPQCGEVFSLAVVDGKLWAIGKQHGKDLALFGPEPPAKPILLPFIMQRSISDDHIFRYGSSPFCQKNFVLLQSRVSPGARSFPEAEALLREAIPLDGVELVTEQSPTWTYLGARVPSYEVGMKLVKHTSRSGITLDRQLFCHDPQVAKKIPLMP